MVPHPRSIFCALAAAFLSQPASFGTTISDDFSSGDSAWTRVSPLEDYGSGGIYSTTSGVYRIEAPSSPDAGQLGPARAGSFREDVTFTDFSASVDLVNLGSNPMDTDLGILGRVREIGLDSTDGYGVTYDMGGQLSLIRFTNERDTLLDSAPISLSSSGSYRLTLSGQGGDLTATVTNLANPSVILATLTAHDTTYASGIAGLLVYDDSVFGDGNAVGSFDNFLLTTIPEPSGLLLAALGSMTLLQGRRRFSARRPSCR